MKCDELKEVMNVMQVSVERKPSGYYKKTDVDEAIVELKGKINLKDYVEQRWFERCMEARTENIKLKRALWLARAEMCRRLDVDRYLRKHPNSWYNENCLTWDDACVAMEVKMCNAERKCLKKAEEYKYKENK